MATTLWIIQATAVASAGCSFPEGETHNLLVFATAPDHDEALSRMRQACAGHGWTGIEVERSGTFPDGPAEIGDEVLRTAAELALRSGCGIVAYDEALPPQPAPEPNRH